MGARYWGAMESRIQELELRYEELQRLVQQLSEVIYAQGRELEAFRSQLRQLDEKVKAEPGLVDASVNERPPHF